MLGNRRLVSVEGKAVGAFLQGLVTQDVLNLCDGVKKCVAGAFLNSKGRVVADALFYGGNEGRILVDVPTENHLAIANMLTRHKLRLPLVVDVLDNHFVAQSFNKADYTDPRSVALPLRRIVASSDGSNSTVEPAVYKHVRMLAGIPEGSSEIENGIPIFYNFDLFGAISFNKGCYTGQELVTRTVRRGIVRRRIFVVSGPGVQKGAHITYEGTSIGTVVAADDQSTGLALLQIPDKQNLCPMNDKEQCKFAHSLLNMQTVEIGNQPGEIFLPSYVTH